MSKPATDAAPEVGGNKVSRESLANFCFSKYKLLLGTLLNQSLRLVGYYSTASL
jgi:hypothetical protein